jgi:hypothetical protein
MKRYFIFFLSNLSALFFLLLFLFLLKILNITLIPYLLDSFHIDDNSVEIIRKILAFGAAFILLLLWIYLFLTTKPGQKWLLWYKKVNMAVVNK